LQDGEQLLRKKLRGRLIHISDWLNEEDSRLVLKDGSGNIICDARKVIHPGSNGDPWWDCDQLLVQVREAIDIFNMVHPNCQALFVFDQSSAHGSLPPDALRVFDMNKLNSGIQRKQRDTIIPQSNPFLAVHSQIQKMTTESGQPKGMKSVLEEWGFDISQLCAKCSPVCPIKNQNCCMAIFVFSY
jgi:hypothetical protein